MHFLLQSPDIVNAVAVIQSAMNQMSSGGMANLSAVLTSFRDAGLLSDEAMTSLQSLGPSVTNLATGVNEPLFCSELHRT